MTTIQDTRHTANVCRTALGWIDDHADVLPGGWSMHVYLGRVALQWTMPDMPSVVTTRLTHLLGKPTRRTDRGMGWAAEGERPELSVVTG